MRLGRLLMTLVREKVELVLINRLLSGHDLSLSSRPDINIDLSHLVNCSSERSYELLLVEILGRSAPCLGYLRVRGDLTCSCQTAMR